MLGREAVRPHACPRGVTRQRQSRGALREPNHRGDPEAEPQHRALRISEGLCGDLPYLRTCVAERPRQGSNQSHLGQGSRDSQAFFRSAVSREANHGVDAATASVIRRRIATSAAASLTSSSGSLRAVTTNPRALSPVSANWLAAVRRTSGSGDWISRDRLHRFRPTSALASSAMQSPWTPRRKVKSLAKPFRRVAFIV